MTRKAMHQPRPAVDFTPVPVRARIDGWTVARQRAFVETLAATGSLRSAAASVNMSESGAIWLRKRPGADSFVAAWEAAIAAASDRIRDLMVDHALNGVPDPVFYQGKQVGERRRFNLRGQQWLVERGDKAKARTVGPAARDAWDGNPRNIPHTCGVGAAEGKFPDYIKRPTHKERIESDQRTLDLFQRFVDGERRALLRVVDTDEKRAAFQLLWGRLDEFPFAEGTWANAEAWARTVVARSLLGQTFIHKIGKCMAELGENERDVVFEADMPGPETRWAGPEVRDRRAAEEASQGRATEADDAASS